MRFEETVQVDKVVRALLLRVHKNKFRCRYVQQAQCYTPAWLFGRIGTALRRLHEIEAYEQQNVNWPLDGDLFEGKVLRDLIEAVLCRIVQVWVCDPRLLAEVDKWAQESDVEEPTRNDPINDSSQSKREEVMSSLVSGKSIVVAVRFEIPVGMSDEQATQAFTTSVSVRGDALGQVREIGAQIATDRPADSPKLAQ
jgi:hypothetical protein